MAKLRGGSSVQGAFDVKGSITCSVDITTQEKIKGNNLEIDNIVDAKEVNAEVMRSNSFNVTSSRERKKDITPSKIDALDIINSVEVVDFKYKEQENDYVHTGFIAEDTDKRLSGYSGTSMSVSDSVGVLIKAIQELDKKINHLESILIKSGESEKLQ